MMSNKSYKMKYSQNFKYITDVEIPSIDEVSRYVMDERNMMLCEGLDLDNMEWYYNYLDTNAFFAMRNPGAYPTYLLDIGYIPLVFLPSCCSKFEVPMSNKLAELDIPSLKLRSMSFTLNYTKLDSFDTWVSKLDIEKIFGIPIQDIRASSVARRIYG